MTHQGIDNRWKYYRKVHHSSIIHQRSTQREIVLFVGKNQLEDPKIMSYDPFIQLTPSIQLNTKHSPSIYNKSYHVAAVGGMGCTCPSQDDDSVIRSESLGRVFIEN